MSHASSSLLKEKEKEIQKKRNIKSRKIDKRKRKMLVSKAFHNIYLCKNSWEFSKKSERADILNIWKMMFQASNLKGNEFLDLLDDNNNIIEPSYAKGGS